MILISGYALFDHIYLLYFTSSPIEFDKYFPLYEGSPLPAQDLWETNVTLVFVVLAHL